MRTIKFRGKSKETNEWLVGSLIVKSDNRCWIEDEKSKQEEVHPDSVGQYTDIKEFFGKGKDIFEGDVVKWTDWGGEENINVVEWASNMSRFVFRNKKGQWTAFSSEYNIEVVGHALTHKHLLT